MDTLQSLAIGLAWVALALVALAVARFVRRIGSSHCLDEELVQNDNHAQGAASTGYYAGVVILFLGVTVGDTGAEPSTGELFALAGLDMLWVLVGILGLNVGRLALDKLVLSKFSIQKEIVQDRNVGTGAVLCGAYIATALVLAGAFHGTTGSWLTALVYFVLGQAALVLMTILYQRVTRYDVHDEIEKDNVAAGVALGGTLVALGVILFGATRAEAILTPEGGLDWGAMLADFGYYAGVGFVLLVLLRVATDKVLLPTSSLDKEIAEDQNLNAAWIESTVAIGMAAVIISMI